MAEIKSYLLEKQLRNKPNSFWEATAYLFAGEETFLKEDLLSSVFAKLGLTSDNIERFDAEAADADNLLSKLETPTFDGDRLVVVIENAEKLKPAICNKMYNDWDEYGFPEFSLPIFLVNKLTNKKLWGLVKEEGVWTKFWHMFGDKIPVWTAERMRAAGIRFERGTEMVLSELCNLDLRHITKEIEKLALTKEVLTPALVKEYIKPSQVVTKYDIELKFILRDLHSIPVIMEKVLADKGVSIKEVVYGLIRTTRYALQASSYLQAKDEFAILLRNLSYNIIPLLDSVDWNSISRKNELLKSASSIIAGIPTMDKMVWTGNLKFENDSSEDVGQTMGSDKKKRKKISKFSITQNSEEKQRETAKLQRQWENSELFNHNIWYKANTYTVIKAFYMASQYSYEELGKTLLDLSKIHHKVFSEGETFMRNNFEILLLSLCIA